MGAAPHVIEVVLRSAFGQTGHSAAAKPEGRASLRRRDFITPLGGAAAWPCAARAQEQVPVIGYLSARSREDTSHLIAAFQRGLAENGYIEGQNVAIEYRWADNHNDRLASLLGTSAS